MSQTTYISTSLAVNFIIRGKPLNLQKHFSTLASGFDDPKVKIFFEDGAVFVQERKNEYDLIIVDSSDPIGSAKVLFQEQFYRNMFDVLKEDGISVAQSEGMFFDRETIRKLFTFNRNIFPILCYYFTMVPTYPSGTIGFSFCSKKYHPIKDIYTKKGISMKNIHSSWSDLRKQLKGQDPMNCQNGETVHIRKSTRPEPRQQVIYDALGLSHYPGRTIKKVVSA